MSMTEHDPRDVGYLALYIGAKKWHTVITAESLLRIANGSSTAKPPAKLTPELKAELQKIINAPGFNGFKTLEKKYRVSRYELITSEEVLIVSKANVIIKSIKEKIDELRKLSDDCIASHCEECFLNNLICVDKTFCDILMAIELDENGKPVYSQKKELQQTIEKYSLSGKGKGKAFHLHNNVIEKFDRYCETHKDKKIMDMVSVALMEYMERHK
jgi:hypothetical protein